MSDSDDHSDDRSADRSIAPIVGVVVGLPFLVFGLWSVFRGNHALEVGGWALASDLTHDLVVAPIVCIVAWALGRVLPAVARGPFRWALATTAVLCLIAWPFVRGYGRNPAVPSLLNRNYAAGLAVYVAVVWVVALAWAVVAHLRHQRV